MSAEVHETKEEFYTVSTRLKSVKNSSGYMMVLEDAVAWVSMDYQYGTYQWITTKELAYKFNCKDTALAAARSNLGPWYHTPKPNTIRVTKITETRTLVSEEVDFD
jgi:hypothetical protein